MPRRSGVSDRHIVAFGGGGFSDGRGVTPLDRYALSLIGRPRPRVCFVPTASGDAAAYIERFYAAFTRVECEPSHLSLFQPPYSSLPGDLASKDLIYVGGGSTANMLAVWRLHGFDRALRSAWEGGVVLCGISAGSMCWFEGGITDSFGELRTFTDGLGLLPGTNCPHYDAEERRPAFHRAIADGGLAGGYGADDGIGLHFVETEFVEAVAERDAVAAYRVEARDGSIAETRIEPRLLEADDARPVTGDDR
jgi:dipeptidase E